MARLNIAFHLTVLTLGGVEVNSMKLATEFIEMGHDVTFIVQSLIGEHVPEIDERIKIINLQTKNIVTGIRKITKTLNKHKFDLLISSRDLYNSILLMIKKRNKLTTHFMVSCHTDAIEENKLFKSKMRRFKTYMYMKMARLTYKNADSIVAVSEGVKNSVAKYTKIHPDKITRIYNPIIDEKFLSKMGEEVQDSLFLENKLVIISAGRLVEQKNFSNLIKAFAKVNKIVPDSRLVIFGEGEQKEILNKYIHDYNLENKAFIKPFTNNLIKYIRASDLFVLSSNWEGFGNVLAEALACGIRLVSTDCKSGPREILKNGEFGLLAKVNDSDDLAAKMLESLNNPHNSEKQIQYSQKFTVKKIALEYIETYEKASY